ncbi:MAG: 30S ribosomal protein S1 [Clostridia bacterium]|nr:30S ribosomal protein S1 [Clostridia bacterium]
MTEYMPEGYCYRQEINKKYLTGELPAEKAFREGVYLEARPYMCDSKHNLHFRLGGIKGFMPYEECAEGIREGKTRDIAVISRVNKPTGFYIKELPSQGEAVAVLSRTLRQEECRKNYISRLVPGDIINACVTHIEPFGAFCDIGSGINALLPIDSISVSRIPTPFARFRAGDRIKAVVKEVDGSGRVTLTHRELLGTWQENADRFNVGETVTGIVRSVESYGIFVELAPNLAGLAEYVPSVSAGQTASVFIKSINPERMKFKLIIIDAQSLPSHRVPCRYFLTEGHIDRWEYSPPSADRKISTNFI